MFHWGKGGQSRPIAGQVKPAIQGGEREGVGGWGRKNIKLQHKNALCT